MSDLEIIKELEEEIGQTFKESNELWNSNTYTLNEDGFVNRLCVDLRYEIKKIPAALLKLKKLSGLRLDRFSTTDLSPLLELENLEKLHFFRLFTMDFDWAAKKYFSKVKGLKTVFFNDYSPYKYIPRFLLELNLPLHDIRSEHDNDGLIINYNIYPPRGLVELGYNDSKFYLDNYDCEGRDKVANVKDGKEHAQAIKELLPLNNNKLLKTHYSTYDKKELPCAIRKIKINNYHGIKNLLIDNIAINSEKNEIRDPRWIFFTGENGYGKTSILQAIAIGLNGERDGDSFLINTDTSNVFLEFKNIDKYCVNSVSPSDIYGNAPYEKFKNLAAYGSSRLNRQSGKIDFDNKKSTTTYSLFNTDGELFDVEADLREWYNDKDRHSLYESAKELLKKLLMPYIDRIEIVVDEHERKQVRYHEKESPDHILIFFNEMASGYKSILAMFGDMIIRLRQVQKKSIKTLSDLSGIVIIDEFDLHLHPKWQRDLVKKLTDLFPKVQFVVSTHSPIPLLGAPPESTVIYNIERTKEEGITAKRLFDIEKKLPNLLPNVLLTSPVFGLDNIKSLYNQDIRGVVVDENYSDEAKKAIINKSIDELFLKNNWENDDLFKEE